MNLSHILLHSLVRGIDLLGMILLAGGLAFRTLVIFPLSDRIPPLERFLPFLLLLTGLSDLVLRSQMISGRPLGEVWTFLPTVLVKSHFGKVWMVRTILLCLLAVASMIKMSKREELALTASGFLLLTASLSGHAADSGALSLPVIVDWLHLVAISAWTGGLFFLALAFRKLIVSSGQEAPLPLLLASVQRFSSLAAVCVALVVATGSYQAWHRVGGIPALLQTSYGQILTVKIVLVILLLCLGALNRYRILPELSQHAVAGSASLMGDSWRRLHNTITFEIGLGLGIIACVALLLQLPPARSQWAIAYKVSSHPAGHLGHEQRASKPALAPAEGASVKILSPIDGALIQGDQIPLHFKLVKGKRGEHVHAYVDGELMGMFKSEKGTLTGVQPGHHVLELRVLAEDHHTEIDATDRIHFVVR